MICEIPLAKLNRAEYKKMGVLVKLNKITWWINHVEISDISGMPV